MNIQNWFLKHSIRSKLFYPMQYDISMVNEVFFFGIGREEILSNLYGKHYSALESYVNISISQKKIR